MKHIRKINELRLPGIIIHDPILEMAPFDVFVYGGDSYGAGRNEHSDPHFHFADKIKGGKWQFSVFIPTTEEWNQNKKDNNGIF